MAEKGLKKDNKDFDESDLEVSSALQPDEEYQDLSTNTQKSWPQLLASLFCLLIILLGLAASAFGIFLLLYSFLSRSYLPAKTHLVKDLYFDYSNSAATATADFRDSLWGTSREGLKSFPYGTKFSVWLELEAAEAHGNLNTDMFQVLAQILTSDGQIAASVSRPCLLTTWSPLVQTIRNLISAPGVLLGLWREHQLLTVPLFSRYPDQPEKPLQAFRAILKATAADGHLPHLYSAKVHIDLALGLIGRALYWLRPGRWNYLAILAVSFSTILGGLITSGIAIVVYLSLGSKSHAPSHSPPHSDNETDTENDGHELEASKQAKEKAFLAGETLPKLIGDESNSLKQSNSSPSAPQLTNKERRKWY